VIDRIPLPQGAVRIEGSLEIMRFYRVEAYALYDDKTRIGERFKGWAMSAEDERVYRYAEEASPEAFSAVVELYKKTFKPQVIESWGPVDLRDTKEQDISGLKPGSGSTVIFQVPANVFQWFWFSGDELRWFTVGVGEVLVIKQRTFRKDVPVMVPTEEELGWPIYPGAEFRPLESTYMPAQEGFPGRKYMVFRTKDDVEKLRTFFESSLGMKATPLYNREGYGFHRQVPGKDFTEWPRLSIEKVPEAYGPNDQVIPGYTGIFYEY
jgi:hypothetical protein